MLPRGEWNYQFTFRNNFTLLRRKSNPTESLIFNFSFFLLISETLKTAGSNCQMQMKKKSCLSPTIFSCSASKIVEVRNQGYLWTNWKFCLFSCQLWYMPECMCKPHYGPLLKWEYHMPLSCWYRQISTFWCILLVALSKFWFGLIYEYSEFGNLWNHVMNLRVEWFLPVLKAFHGKVRKHQQYIGACMTEVRKHHH